MIGTDFNILSISPSVEKLLGYKAEDFIGKPASDLRYIFTSESFERAITNINKILNGEIISETIYAFIAKDGTLKHVEINGSPLIRDGQYSGMISVARDITERKQAEETLKESENKYRLLADNIHDVVFVMDMNLNYTYLSPSVKILRGYEPEEALKHTPAETMTTSSVDLALSALFEIMEIEKSEHRDVNISRTLQLEMSRKDGTTVWVETTAYFIRDENQRPIGIMGLTRDITERKKAEDELRESELRYQKLSIIDNLTQLYNSRHFYAQLERETERSNRYEQPLTILLWILTT